MIVAFLVFFFASTANNLVSDWQQVKIGNGGFIKGAAEKHSWDIDASHV